MRFVGRRESPHGSPQEGRPHLLRGTFVSSEGPSVTVCYLLVDNLKTSWLNTMINIYYLKVSVSKVFRSEFSR